MMINCTKCKRKTLLSYVSSVLLDGNAQCLCLECGEEWRKFWRTMSRKIFVHNRFDYYKLKSKTFKEFCKGGKEHVVYT